MDEGCIGPGGGDAGPLGFLRGAVLVQVLLGPVLLFPFLFAYPPQQHRVMAPEPVAAKAGAAPAHELVLASTGTAILDGRPLDLVGLYDGLTRIAGLEPGAVLHFRPDPDVRYEQFLELLAMTKRVRIGTVRIDNGEHVEALDDYEYREWRAP